jgi:membrane protease YdiL (CAAX protease family)
MFENDISENNPPENVIAENVGNVDECFENELLKAEKREEVFKKSLTPLTAALIFLAGVLFLNFVPEIIGIALVGSGALYNISDRSLFLLNLALNLVIFLGLGAIVLIFCMAQKKSFLGVTGLNKKLSFLNVVQIALVSVLSIFAFIFFTTLFAFILQLIGYEPDSSMPDPGINEALMFLINIFFVCMLPALFEETLFRGAILNGYKNGFSLKLAIILCALCFSLMHRRPEQTVHQFFLGIMLAYVVIETRSLWAGIILHFFNNLISISLPYIIYFIMPDLGVSFSSRISFFAAADALDVVDGIVSLAMLAVVSAGAMVLLYMVLRTIGFKQHIKEGKPIENFNYKDRIMNLGKYPSEEEEMTKTTKNMVGFYVVLGIALGICVIFWILNLIIGLKIV